jgi:hypothetical protein
MARGGGGLGHGGPQVVRMIQTRICAVICFAEHLLQVTWVAIATPETNHVVEVVALN